MNIRAISGYAIMQVLHNISGSFKSFPKKHTMAIINETYDQFKIDKLKHFIEDMAAKGQPKPFEIFVDNLKVIPRTEDAKEFENYEYYMNENTEKIRIVIYNSNRSPRNEQYCFLVQQNHQSKSLNGLGEIENLIQEKLTAKDREYELKKIQEQLVETKEQLEEAEEYAETLEAQIEDMKVNKFRMGNLNLAELASVMAESFVRRNPHLIAKIPGAESLAGIIIEDNETLHKKQITETVTEGEVSFKKKTTNNETLTEEEKRYAVFLAQLEQTFNEAQLADIMQVLQKLAEQPTQLEVIKKLLKI